MRSTIVILISAMMLAVAVGAAMASLHVLRPPPPPSALSVLVGTVTHTDKDPL